MMAQRWTRIFVTVASVAGAWPAAAQQPLQPTLDRVKALYESAAYDEAIVVVDQIAQRGEQPTEGGSLPASVQRYRALCLLALNRASEADDVIERMVIADPASRPDPNDTPPRLLAAIERARTRVLPTVARKHYDNAKTYFDRKQHAEAAAEFARGIALLDDPALASSGAATGDLRTLAAGFLELSRVAIAIPIPAPEAIPRAAPGIYTDADSDVIPPVTISQDVPAWKLSPSDIIRQWSGSMTVLIDERGEVESAVIVKPMNTKNDKLLLDASKRWRYSPATKGGVPVKFRKTVNIQLSSAPPR